MPKIKFSSIAIRDLKSSEKPVEFTELGRIRGEGVFGIRVNPNGSKRWFAMYSIQNKLKRFPLGNYPAVSLVEARRKMNELITRVQRGDDPQAEKAAYRNAPTMSDLWVQYQKAQSLRKVSKAPSTLKEEGRKWRKDIEPHIGNIKVADITRKDLTKFLRKKAATSPVQANRTFSLLRLIFTEALELGWLKHHPMAYMRKPGGPEQSRSRFLTDDEIRTMWPYFNVLPHNHRDIMKLGLLTAQRSGEIMSIRWEDIDWERKIWTQSLNKTRSQQIVPLSDQVLKILQDRRNGVGYTKRQMWKLESEWVFPSRHNNLKAVKEKHTTSVSKSRDKLKEWTGINGWTSHDLRRTSRTLMSRIQVDYHIRERIIGHSQSGIVSVYDMYDFLEEKRDGLQRLADEIADIIKSKEQTRKII